MKGKSKFRKGLERIVAGGIIFFGSLVGSANASAGQLEIFNKLKEVPGSNGHYIVNHIETASEGYNPSDPDIEYSYNPPPPSGFKTKTISEVDGKELWLDSRSFQNKYINLELSLHSESGGSVSIISKSELECVIDPGNYGWTFGNKPITLQQQDLSDLNKDGKVDFYDYAILANDYRKTGNALAGDISGEYDISDGHVDFHDVAYFSGGWLNKRAYPVYDVRDVNEFNNGVIPLPDLDGTYLSEKTHTRFKLRFNRFLSDLDDDGKVDLRDFVAFANEWKDRYGQIGINSVADISGPNGIPDGNVDHHDLSAFSEDFLKDITDPNTW